jgi:ATP phosphoribosyltransferase regulatory subunit
VKLPSGVRDWLPRELAAKRAVEATLRAVFERWGYAEVQTPTFERFDVLESGLGEALAEQTFRFSDRRGVALALRPEMTTPIARLVSTRMRNEPLPLRLCYVAPAYRYEEPQEGRMREFTQGGYGVDRERRRGRGRGGAVHGARSVRRASGCATRTSTSTTPRWSTAFSHRWTLHASAAAGCKGLIADRNLVGLREMFAAEPQRLEVLLSLATLRGGSDVLAFARRACTTEAGAAGIDRLAEILARAADRGFAARVSIDLGLLRDLEYYTGFIFEGFVDELGFALCGGGRYDTLLPRFGYDAGAVGWMVSVERLLIALERRAILA